MRIMRLARPSPIPFPTGRSSRLLSECASACFCGVSCGVFLTGRKIPSCFCVQEARPQTLLVAMTSLLSRLTDRENSTGSRIALLVGGGGMVVLTAVGLLASLGKLLAIGWVAFGAMMGGAWMGARAEDWASAAVGRQGARPSWWRGACCRGPAVSPPSPCARTVCLRRRWRNVVLLTAPCVALCRPPPVPTCLYLCGALSPARSRTAPSPSAGRALPGG